MSSTTSRAAFYKPAGGENVNVTTDLNNNWDKLDTNLNFRVAASATARNAISPFWAGLAVRDTDTGKTWVSNGSAPISASWSQIPNSGSSFDSDIDIAAGKQFNSGGTSSTASFAAQNTATGDDLISGRITTDTQSRYLVDTDGKTWWGPGGATTQDTNLYRDSTNVLATDDEFLIKGGNLILSSGGTAEKNVVPSTSTTVANTTTETVIATYNIPANDMIAGAVYKITAWGTAGVTGTPTLAYKARHGGVAGSLLATCTFTASSGVTNKVWKAELYVVCLTTGASGTVFGNLDCANGVAVAGANPVTNPTVIMDGGSALTVDTTASKDLVITTTWSAASASNTVTCRGFAAERIA
jgi:hypothetical protein